MNQQVAFEIYRFTQMVRGEPVLQVLDDLNKSQWYSADEIRELQLSRLQNILSHAYETVPYYTQMFRSVNAFPQDIKKLEDLELLPTLTKETLKTNWGQLLSSRPKSKTRIEQTAGSTGRPLKIKVDRMFWAHQHANIFRHRSWFGVGIGAPRANIWGRFLDSGQRRKLKVRDLLVNKIRLSAFEVPNNAIPFFYRMKKERVECLWGYSSSLVNFCHQLKKNHIEGKELNLKLVVPSADLLGETEKKFVEDTLGAPVANLYGATEVGMLGLECPHGRLHIPSESALVEALPTEDPNVFKAVITELHNSAMPMIRYELGDLFSGIEHGVCECGRSLPVIKGLVGRSASIIETPDGRYIHDLFFGWIIKALEAKGYTIVQYQFRRISDNSFECLLIGPDAGNSDLWSFIEKELKEILWREVDLKVVEAEEIPLPKSGKLTHYLDLRNQSGS